MAPQSAMASSQIINEEADQNRYSRRWNEAVGIKFKPTADVLVRDYLAGWVSGSTDGPIFPLIPDVNVYQYEPSKLKSIAYDFGDGNMYFFSRTRKKYPKGKNPDRTAEGGFWKTGKVNDVKDKDDRKIGTERSLTYYKSGPGSGSKESIKTNWLMKEYNLLKGQDDKEPMVPTLCCVYFHDKKRRQIERENEVLYDNENNQRSLPDEGETEGSASSKNKNLLDMSTTEIHPGVSGKRQRSSNPEAVTLEQTLPPYSYPSMPNTGSLVDQSNVFTPGPNCNPPLYSTPKPADVTFGQDLFFPLNFCQNMTDIINAPAPNSNFPLYISNSNPAVSTPELPSSNSYQDIHNMMGGSPGAPTDSNITPGPNCNPPLYSTPKPADVTFGQDLFFPLYFCQNMTDIINAPAPNSNFPLYISNSNPAVSTPELRSSNSYQDIHNMMGGSPGAPTDSNIDTLNWCPSTPAELDPDWELVWNG